MLIAAITVLFAPRIGLDIALAPDTDSPSLTAKPISRTTANELRRRSVSTIVAGVSGAVPVLASMRRCTSSDMKARIALLAAPACQGIMLPIPVAIFIMCRLSASATQSRPPSVGTCKLTVSWVDVRRLSRYGMAILTRLLVSLLRSTTNASRTIAGPRAYLPVRGSWTRKSAVCRAFGRPGGRSTSLTHSRRRGPSSSSRDARPRRASAA